MAESWDVLDEPIGDATTWTRVNVGEAFPGVPTPLTWTWAGPPSDLGISRGWVRMGVFPAARAQRQAVVADRFVAISRGRALLNLNLLREIGDRIPGNSGDKIEQTLFQSEEVSGTSRPVRRRYPFVATKLPVAVTRARRSLLGSAPRTHAWWAASVRRLAGEPEAARSLLTESADRYAELAMNQAITTVAGSGLFDALSRLCARQGLPEAAGALATTAEHTAEVATVEDLWHLARGGLALDAFLARHGYHAPVQGELAAPSWRSDPVPVHRLAGSYARRGDDEDPAALQARRRAERDATERDLLGRLPATARPAARSLIRIVGGFVPLREVARLQFLQCYDVARAAAETLGRELAAGGALDEPNDVYYLTVAELLARTRPEPGLVDRRRRQRAHYEAHDIPVKFTGTPELQPIRTAAPSDLLEGVPGSAGVVEGFARVIQGPDDPNGLEEGEVLVAETTNPSYAPFFLVASAVVVDIGGPLSHGAIVAREMGIPCVINTKHARHSITTGDLIRVDGNRGIVEVLKRTEGKDS